MATKRSKRNITVKSDPIQQPVNITQQNITVRPVNRQSSDISSWKKAIQAAESTNDRRTLLYDLYANIMLDGHLTGVAGKFINAVVGAEWEFSKDGKTLDHVNDLIDTNEFEAILKAVVESKLWGVSWVELTNFTAEGFNVWNMPRKHIRPKTGILASEQSGDTGTVNVNEGIFSKTVLQIGDIDDLGLLMKVAQYVIYKRGNFGDWAQFAEIFGMPFRVGEYDAYDEGQRIQLEKALEEAGSAAYAVVPKGSGLRFEKNGATGDGQLYKNLKDACNQEISVTLLGVTETTTSSTGSGYAQSETHSDEQEKIFKGLRDFTRRILNRKLIPILRANGVDTQGGYFIVKGEGEEKLTLKERYEIHKSMYVDLGLPIDPDSFYEIFGMTKPDNFNQLMAKMEAQRAAQAAFDNINRNQAKEKNPKESDEPTTELAVKPKSWSERAKYFFGVAQQS